jgi:diguanylate cyclase (GGDEF)-like protein
MERASYVDSWCMRRSVQDLADSRRVMARAAAAMYGAAAVDGLIEIVLPRVPSFSLLPIAFTTGLFILLVTVGPHLSRRVLAANGPIGVALVSYALATTRVTASDAAVLYALPVLWQSLFYGRRGAGAILAVVALGDGLALVALGRYGYPERWVDVMVSVSAIAIVVVALQERNERLLERVSLEARLDPLTGLLNRRGFDERAAIELARQARDPRPFALATFDVDRFKLINDEWGHDVGDRVLQHIGRLLTDEARDVDVLARFGGEEFVVLLPGTDVTGAEQFADRVRQALATRTGGLPAARLSAGVCAGDAATDVTALVATADLALYDAKRSGRDRTRVHNAA